MAVSMGYPILPHNPRRAGEDIDDLSKTGKTLYWNPEEGKLLTMMKQKGRFLALSTLENNYRKTYGQGGADAIKNSMEVEYRSKMPKLSP
ncbi:hypothetical protein RRG08_021447 [Elysia crispata]|uniref:Uncharacterized protein n=1 Tax=Elysia crispata TaxID=231223 RepID=A0AAE0XMB4_9GAST|nr:hypothetical protein RRG08_021447 [Elysia crispata]